MAAKKVAITGSAVGSPIKTGNARTLDQQISRWSKSCYRQLIRSGVGAKVAITQSKPHADAMWRTGIADQQSASFPQEDHLQKRLIILCGELPHQACPRSPAFCTYQRSHGSMAGRLTAPSAASRSSTGRAITLAVARTSSTITESALEPYKSHFEWNRRWFTWRSLTANVV